MVKVYRYNLCVIVLAIIVDKLIQCGGQLVCLQTCPTPFLLTLGNCWWWPPPNGDPKGTYDQLEAHCQTLNSNAHIGSVTTQAEEDMITARSPIYIGPGVTGMIFYLGGRSDSSSTWKWADGSTWSYVPANSKMSHADSCTVVAVGVPYIWVSDTCEHSNGFAPCKMAPTSTCGNNLTPSPATPAPVCPQQNVYGDFAEAVEHGYYGTSTFEQMILPGKTLLECGAACLTQGGACVSFDYNVSTNDCRLMQSSNLYPCGGLAQDDNWRHYDYINGNAGG